MSQRNVEVLRAFFAAWNAGDMDSLRELHDPDAIMRAPQGWPEPGPEVGRDAIMRQFERLRAAWVADSAEVTGDFIDAGERVLARFTWHTVGQGPGSHMEFTQLTTIRNGRIVLNEYFWDHQEALKAAGMAE